MKKALLPILLLSLCALVLSGCIIIDFNVTGIKTGYSKLSEETKKKVVITNESDDCEDFIFDDEHMIYAINGQQLLSCLKDTEKAVVYEWAAHCGSKNCVLLSYFKRTAEQHGYQPFVVSQYLTEDMFPQIASSPDLKTFWINEFYYGSKYCNKNLYRFIEDITNGISIEELNYNRFYLFEDGKFSRTIENIDMLADGEE